MVSITQKIRINASKEKVWAIIANLGAVVNFHPYVLESYYTSESLEGIGAARQCVFPKMEVNERAIDWKTGEHYTLAIDFLKGTIPPICNMQAGLRVEADGKNSLFTITMYYEPKFGILGKIMNRLMIQSQFERMLQGVVQGLKHHAETGELVTGDLAKQLRSLSLSPA